MNKFYGDTFRVFRKHIERRKLIDLDLVECRLRARIRKEDDFPACAFIVHLVEIYRSGQLSVFHRVIEFVGIYYRIVVIVYIVERYRNGKISLTNRLIELIHIQRAVPVFRIDNVKDFSSVHAHLDMVAYNLHIKTIGHVPLYRYLFIRQDLLLGFRAYGFYPCQVYPSFDRCEPEFQVILHRVIAS